MRGRDDHRHASGDVLEHHMHQGAAFVVGEGELLGKIRENAQAVRARVDHEVDATLLAFEVETPFVVEDGRRDRKHAAVRGLGACLVHDGSICLAMV